jgi:hypothetical protein
MQRLKVVIKGRVPKSLVGCYRGAVSSPAFWHALLKYLRTISLTDSGVVAYAPTRGASRKAEEGKAAVEVIRSILSAPSSKT